MVENGKTIAYFAEYNYPGEFFMRIEFEWDEKKNAANKKKHGISFEEAKTCFEDEHARVFFDEEHSAINNCQSYY